MKAKITKAEIGSEGQVRITVEIIDEDFRWQKDYDYYTTEPIGLTSFKARIKKDVQDDLQIKDNVLSEIKPEIGKVFDLGLDNQAVDKVK